MNKQDVFLLKLYPLVILMGLLSAIGFMYYFGFSYLILNFVVECFMLSVLVKHEYEP